MENFLKSLIQANVWARFAIWFVGITLAVATVGTATGSFGSVTATISVVAVVMAALTGPHRKI